MPHALGLFVFVATAAIYAGMLVTRISHGLGSLVAIATAFSLLVAIIALFAMMVDAVDAWVQGRSMSQHGRRMVRSLVSVALIGSLATAVLARQVQQMFVLGPALVIYLFIARDSLTPNRIPRRGPDAAPSQAVRRDVPRSRQKRGGKKHR